MYKPVGMLWILRMVLEKLDGKNMCTVCHPEYFENKVQLNEHIYCFWLSTTGGPSAVGET